MVVPFRRRADGFAKRWSSRELATTDSAYRFWYATWRGPSIMSRVQSIV